MAYTKDPSRVGMLSSVSRSNGPDEMKNKRTNKN